MSLLLPLLPAVTCFVVPAVIIAKSTRKPLLLLLQLLAPVAPLSLAPPPSVVGVARLLALYLVELPLQSFDLLLSSPGHANRPLGLRFRLFEPPPHMQLRRLLRVELFGVPLRRLRRRTLRGHLNEQQLRR